MKVSNFRAESNHDIHSNRIIYCSVASDSIIWFGTVGGGMIRYDPRSDNFTTFTTDNGLPNNTVYAIVEDRAGLLWITTNRGLSQFDPSTTEFVNYTVDDGLIGNQFNFRSGTLTRSGTVYLGAVNGLTYFNPDNLEMDRSNPEVHFTDLKIANQSVAIGEEGILDAPINMQDHIHLKYQHKVITIEFVGLNFAAPGKTQYAYYLEGLENDWNYMGHLMTATYTNLSPGNYIFHVKAAYGDQFEGANERMLYIRIHPPFWLSVWGFVLYAAILLSLTFMIFRFYTVRQKARLNVKLAKLEKEKNEEISRHRLNFFTYISHEFKTPLTLILATLDHIMNYEEILPRFRDYGLIMKKNAQRLLFLINQLMDFRKMESDHAAIRLNKGEVIGFIKSTFHTFYPLMETRSVQGIFTSNMDSYIVYFDADKLEKILTNLISNSCKSFREPGRINVDVKVVERSQPARPGDEEEKSGQLLIMVADNGPGIPPEKLKLMFEPFVGDNRGDVQSSGIGLSLIKSLVNYLNGEIHVKSSQKGTSVIIRLPLIHHPSPDLVVSNAFVERNTSLDVENAAFLLDSQPDLVFSASDNRDGQEYDMLIVEDNWELASFLHNHYSGAFRVKVAGDGISALEKIGKTSPDIIISDIMMPRMDGFELCNRIKESIETCHIPVILLTSRTHDDSKIEGYLRGADAYVGKPFNLRELDLQIRNILQAKKNIRRHFAKLDAFKETVEKLGNRDQMFVRKLTDAIHRHLDDGSFNVDNFCRELNVSRTLLHMKLKKITGLSTTEFMKKIRLNEAKRMLEEGSMTISEIAYSVGFNDPAYFSKSFKKQYGKIPSSLIKEAG
jgi:signal transduction histidine kinase/DNA-binding response OmpR family regulator